MKDVLVGNKKYKFSFKSKLLLGTLVLALAVAAGFDAAARAAPEDEDTDETTALLYGQKSLFDPFTLNSSNIMDIMPESSEGLIGSAPLYRRPPIRIPFRPVPRSPFQPP